MKVYALRPALDVFDGSGALSEAAAYALGLIADIVVDSLQADGDASHQAVFWEGSSYVGDPPICLPISDPAQLRTMAFRMLDPNDTLGGSIRSAVNCRSATFGYDGQAQICMRHVDAAPIMPEGDILSITEISRWLTSTDLLDGVWPDQ